MNVECNCEVHVELVYGMFNEKLYHEVYVLMEFRNEITYFALEWLQFLGEHLNVDIYWI